MCVVFYVSFKWLHCRRARTSILNLINTPSWLYIIKTSYLKPHTLFGHKFPTEHMFLNLTNLILTYPQTNILFLKLKFISKLRTFEKQQVCRTTITFKKKLRIRKELAVVDKNETSNNCCFTTCILHFIWTK